MKTAIVMVLAAAAALAGCASKTTEVSTAPVPAAQVVVSYEPGTTTQAKQTTANGYCAQQYGVGLGVFVTDDWAGHATYSCTKA